MGEAVAYELVPGDNVAPMALPGSQFRRRAGFLDHHLWVTPYRRDERFPAGEYPNQHEGGDGRERHHDSFDGTIRQMVGFVIGSPGRQTRVFA